MRLGWLASRERKPHRPIKVTGAQSSAVPESPSYQSAGASYHEQCLVNKLHGIGQLLRLGESLGQETASELHPDQRQSFLEPLHLCESQETLLHIPGIGPCPTSQHPPPGNQSGKAYSEANISFVRRPDKPPLRLRMGGPQGSRNDSTFRQWMRYGGLLSFGQLVRVHIDGRCVICPLFCS